MGRTRTKKAQRALKSTVVSTNPTVVPQPPVESLVEKTQILLAQCNYELAHKFIKRILERDSTHVEGREMLGLVELENENIEAAKAASLPSSNQPFLTDSSSQVFVTLIPPSLTAPNPPSASAYLYLAQLTDDEPNKALELYRNALNLMSSQLKGKAPASQEPKSSEMEEQTRKTAVRTVIAMVEIWMSDLCFEPQAETECESLLKLAFELDPENPEALVSLASVRISQQRPEEAKDLVQRSWAVWKDLESDDAALPPISSRLSLTRLMLELSMYTQALTILHGVLASDEQEVEAWYLRGWCFFLMADAFKEGQSFEDAGELTWEDMKRDARVALEKCKELHIASEHPDEQILEHTKELIGELEVQGFHGTTHDDEGEDAQEGEAGEWVDEDDSDIEMS